MDNFYISLGKTSLFHSFLFFLIARFPTVIRWISIFRKIAYVNESRIGTNNLSVPNGKDTIYLIDGYWQTMKYVQEMEPILRRELTWKYAHLFDGHPLLDRIRTENSVGVHARMMRQFAGDGSLVSADESKNLSADYFAGAVKSYTANLAKPCFFVFSDNLQLFEERVTVEKNTHILVKHEHSAWPEADLYLLTHCKHFIISNSTFGWWGAFMGHKSESHIMVPPKEIWDGEGSLLSIRKGR